MCRARSAVAWLPTGFHRRASAFASPCHQLFASARTRAAAPRPARAPAGYRPVAGRYARWAAPSFHRAQDPVAPGVLGRLTTAPTPVQPDPGAWGWSHPSVVARAAALARLTRQ